MRRSIVPATTREGEFASGGTGGFDALESYLRQRSPVDEAREAEARRHLQQGIRTGNFVPLTSFMSKLKAQGLPQKYLDRLTAMAGRGLRLK